MSDRKEEMGRLADRASRNDDDEQASDADSTESEEVSSDDSSDEASPSEETSSKESQPDETAAEAPSDASDDDPDAVRHVKDRPSVYMYLPKEYSKEVDIACQMINLTYQRETGDKLPKNRYLYPIVTKVGYENAADLSFDEIHTLKTEIDEVDADETET
jgi:hypothetical protein